MTIKFASNITILKTFSLNDSLCYRNHAFSSVGFCGKVKRIFYFLVCKDGFRDCHPDFITKKMVQFYNHSNLTSKDAAKILKKITRYAKKHGTENHLLALKKKVLDKKPSKEINNNPIKPENSAKDGVSDSEESSESEVSDSESADLSDEEKMDGQELLKQIKNKEITENEAISKITSGEVQLTPKRAVKLFTTLSKSENADSATLHSAMPHLEVGGGLTRFLIRKLALSPIPISKASWEKVINSLSIEGDSFQDDYLRLVANKDTKDLTSKQALQVVNILKSHNEEIAQEFTRKLPPDLIRDIVDAHIEGAFEDFEQYIDGEKLYNLCALEYRFDYINVLIDNYVIDQESFITILPSTFKTLWQDFFMGMELEMDVLKAVAIKLLGVHKSSLAAELRALRGKVEQNDIFKANLLKLKTLNGEAVSLIKLMESSLFINDKEA